MQSIPIQSLYCNIWVYFSFCKRLNVFLRRNKHLFDELLDQEESYTDGEDESEDININDEN